MNRHDFRMVHRLRVRWAEVDMQKIVFNAHYLMYFDTAISDYWRALALPYEESMHQLGGELYVKKAAVEYHASARFDDQLEVGLRCSRIGNSSMIFSGAIFRGEALLVTCELVYVFADPVSQTSRQVPPVLRSLVERFESGEAVIDIRVGDWAELERGSATVRAAVFTEEQGIDPGKVVDEMDTMAVHAVAFNALGQAVGTGRLLGPTNAQAAKIGRMAVHHALRGSHLGQGILRALMTAAKKQGYAEVMLHAQRSAEGFYLRQGFVVRGAPFKEAGIDHIEMMLTL